MFEPCLQGYAQGLTPNPDVDCNRQLKFGHFQDRYRDQLLKFNGIDGSQTEGKWDLMATGHYAQLRFDGNQDPLLLRGLDSNKDQSYFLSTVPRQRLSRTLFPVGDLHKDQVRSMAKENGLGFLLERPESMGLCFVGQRSGGFGTLLNEYLTPEPGSFLPIDFYPTWLKLRSAATGTSMDHAMWRADLKEELRRVQIAQHQGIHLYTLGQSARLSGQPKKWWVVGKDREWNILFVSQDRQHPSLQSESCTINVPSELRSAAFHATQAQIRYRSEVVACKVKANEEHESLLDIQFLHGPAHALAPGQVVALYHDDVCLAGGSIVSMNSSMPKFQSVLG